MQLVYLNSCREKKMNRSFTDKVNSVLRQLMTLNNVTQIEMKIGLDVILNAYLPQNLKTNAATALNFYDANCRCAYLATHFINHVFCIKNLWLKWKDEELVQKWLAKLKERKQMTVCCLGGGPGSDIIGTQLFFQEFDFIVKFRGSILDHCTKWAEVYQSLYQKIDESNAYTLGQVKHVYFNFFQTPVDDDFLDEIHSVDLLTLMKFVSAVGYEKKQCENILANLLKHLKSGALVFFMDNNGKRNYEMMENAAEMASLKLISMVIQGKVYSGDPHISSRGFLNFSEKSMIITASLWIKP